ncbi:SDR family NAD(P)-dependent oxidoreductase [Shouchella clausii]|uniref:SDR family NAD(P)-dependent oxidoreductase n=1 Tax=Shouchella clausii TaxID=79880 RepID=UPI00211C089B|nr:SDR family oxidoreductase [Shouchella clausii]
MEGFGAYAAMKGAVEVLTKYMAKEWGKRGIRINVVAPGAIATDFGGGAVRDNPQMNEHVASNIALGRVGEADDIGGVIASLCTEEFSWVNGTRLEVSGGQML